MMDKRLIDIKAKLDTGICACANVLECYVTQLEGKDKSISEKELRGILYSYTVRLSSYIETTELTVSEISDMIVKCDAEENISAVGELEALLNKYFVIRAVLEEFLTNAEDVLSSNVEVRKLDILKQNALLSQRKIKTLTRD